MKKRNVKIWKKGKQFRLYSPGIFITFSQEMASGSQEKDDRTLDKTCS